MNNKQIESNINLFYKHYEDLITYYSSNSKIKISLKDKNQNNCLIFISFKSQTITMDYSSNINFLIIINAEEYVIEPPRVLCLSDVSIMLYNLIILEFSFLFLLCMITEIYSSQLFQQIGVSQLL